MGRGSPPSQVDSQWWARVLRPLRWTLGGGQGLSTLSGGLSVVDRASPPSQVDSGWWTRAFCPLRWTLRGGQWFSELSGELSYWILPVFHSPADKSYSKIFLYFGHFHKFNRCPHHLPIITNVHTELITHRDRLLSSSPLRGPPHCSS